MSRKLWSGALGLVLVLAACGGGRPASQAVKISFVPQTVDFVDDVGYSPSLVVGKDGSPFMSYLGFTHVLTAAEKKQGVLPQTRPVTAPRLPAVLVATQVNGIWARGAAVQSSDLATGPKVPVDRSDQTATAVDQNGIQHVVWTQKNGLFYSNNSSGNFPDTPKKITGSAVRGPSIAIDSSGKPWIAYYSGNSVEAATLSGKKFTVQKVASVGTCGGCPPVRTAIQVGRGGPIVAFVDPGRTAMLATQSGKSWSVKGIGTAPGGFGIAIAVDAKGAPHVSYFTEDGSVVSASGNDQTATVGSVSVQSPAKDLAGGTAIAVASNGTEYVAWADPARGVRLAASSNGTAFKEVATEGTQGGTLPTMAATADGEAVLAWFVPKTADLMLGTYPVKEVGLLAAPSPSATVAPGGGGPGQACAPSDIKVLAPPGAATTGFGTTKLSAPGAKPFAICFDNKDSTVHNVAIFKSESDATSGGKPLFTGDAAQGPTQVEYKVNPFQAGSYFFRCDFHPTTMTGTLTVR